MKKLFSLLSFACTIVFGAHYSAQAQIITTIAGTASHGYNGDDIAATSAKLNFPTNLVLDRWNNIYVADYLNSRVRKITPDGVIHTIAGNGMGAYAGDGGPATNAQLVPYAVALDSSGNVYVADYGNNRVRKITPAGIISTVAGNGSVGGTGDGGPATDAKLESVNGVAIDPAGNLYISSSANTVRKVNLTTGIISHFAGASGGFGGDGGPAASAQFNSIAAVSTDLWGNVYVTDNGNRRIRKINTAGIIHTIAGSSLYTTGYAGDGGPATSAQLSPVQSCAVDVLGNLYIADGVNHVIRVVDTAGIITTYAGNATGAGTITGSYSGDGGQATAAGLNFPIGTAVDADRNLYIADYYNHRIRKVLAAPVAFIAASKDTICTDSCVTFINTGLGTTDSIRWVVPGHVLANPHADTIKVCYSATGNDTVSLYMYNVSGGDTTIRWVHVRDCPAELGIAPAATQAIDIFPNPAGNNITVEHAGAGARIHIYNAQGQLALDIQATANREVIDTHALPEGIYCMSITGAGYQTVKVFTIVR